MPKLERHVFVCCNQRAPDAKRPSCAARDAEAVRAAFKAALARHHCQGRVRANQAGCLDQCEHGVTVVVYPEQVWYGFVTPADVDEIVTTHLLGGAPVTRLRLADSCVNVAACPHRPA